MDADDDMKRIVKPPTTAATLNLAACAAQASRLWKDIDSDFAEKCLEAAEIAFAAAKKHPKMYAPLDESIGGGAYGDTDVDDEFCWAALELFITTGNEDYYDEATENKFFLDIPQILGGGESVDTAGSFDWGNTGALATLSASLNPEKFDKGDVEIIHEAIISAADHFISMENYSNVFYSSYRIVKLHDITCSKWFSKKYYESATEVRKTALKR